MPDPNIPADLEKKYRKESKALAVKSSQRKGNTSKRSQAASKKQQRGSKDNILEADKKQALAIGKDMPVIASPEALAIRYSHPTWLFERWCELYGQEAAVKLMIRNNTHPTYSVRSNIEKGPWAYGSAVGALNKALEDTVGHQRASEVHSVPSDYAAGVVRSHSGQQVIVQSGLLSSGKFSVQDEAAGLVVYALSPSPGDVVVDACAAPGGKAMLAAMMMRGKGTLIAIDVNEKRLDLVRNAANEQGYHAMMHYHAGDFIVGTLTNQMI